MDNFYSILINLVLMTLTYLIGFELGKKIGKEDGRREIKMKYSHALKGRVSN
jgi:hypothetical protein